MMPTSLLLVELQIVIMTTSSGTGDDQAGIKIILSVLCN